MIPNTVIEAVKCFKRTHPYVGSYEERARKFGSVLNVLSYYYSVPVPSLYVYDDRHSMTPFDEYIYVTKGCYDPAQQRISLRKFSVISLLHEFRHHLQHVLGLRCDDIEDDANVWSHLIYKKVWPHNFQKIKINGELNGTSVEI